jgi:hypothetical protein
MAKLPLFDRAKSFDSWNRTVSFSIALREAILSFFIRFQSAAP